MGAQDAQRCHLEAALGTETAGWRLQGTPLRPLGYPRAPGTRGCEGGDAALRKGPPAPRQGPSSPSHPVPRNPHYPSSPIFGSSFQLCPRPGTFLHPGNSSCALVAFPARPATPGQSFCCVVGFPWSFIAGCTALPSGTAASPPTQGAAGPPRARCRVRVYGHGINWNIFWSSGEGR